LCRTIDLESSKESANGFGSDVDLKMTDLTKKDPPDDDDNHDLYLDDQNQAEEVDEDMEEVSLPTLCFTLLLASLYF
jgi:hypothetical protein